MGSIIKELAIAAVAGLSLVGATFAGSTSAEARYYHRGWGGGGWVGPAVVGGLALGALAASTPTRHTAMAMVVSEIGSSATRLTAARSFDESTCATSPKKVRRLNEFVVTNFHREKSR